MAFPKRGPAYTVDEDLQLCHFYLDVSQCPINGVNQKKDALWERIAVAYNEGKSGERIRTGMSLQSRFSDLCLPVSKLRGHIRQIEHQNPSGASEEWILKKAKESLQDDPTFKRKKFKFDHVWPILKDAEKWLDNAAPLVTRPRRKKKSLEGSEAGSQTTETSENPSFCVDLDVDEDQQEYINDELPIASQQRPMGTKMAKMRRKVTEEKKKCYEKIIADNKAIKELLEKNMREKVSFATKMEHYTSNKLDIQRQRDEDKIMLTSLDSIADPVDREFLKMRKTEIMHKKARELQSQGSSFIFGHDNVNYLNQIQNSSESTFHSGNFVTTFPSFGFEKSGARGGPSYVGGSCQNETSRDEHVDDANLPEY